ncbi:hypothetical protein [Occallatibacter savannae]|uniref:hypothetical protein n=1 Tax=Occallatibacter savannae TaxID=1002691 RepID=UPI000D698FCE|nr:hypothetical protein [Occallatibacter savannae]
MTEKLIDALADLFALSVECTDFFLEGFHQIALFVELTIEHIDPLFRSGAGLALALHETDCTGDAVFKSGKISAAESEIALMVVIHFRVLVFRDLGFQR